MINRFVEAQDQSILYANAHPQQAIGEIPSVSGLSSAAAAASVPPKIVWTDLLSPSSLVSYEDLMIKFKALEGSALTAGAIAYTAPDTPMQTLLFGNGGKYTGGKSSKKK